ncbi:single-stranded DNA-binding protein [Changpingibacter yushuensis]|uniref:single-stranded DNA-binding protein n=1 Tax=Changpingibacter yushuensis TaxID=2758440 RepID=UPI00165E61EF|nr:single-stranded DNA-binding protein [Changpingibacter yushuensis]
MNEPVVTVVGNMTGDPELRYVSSGIPVASFTVASTPRTLNRQTNQWEDGEAMFVRCSVWREYAENVAESLTKGMRVVVTGRMTVRSYEHNGERRTSIELQVDEVGPSLRYARAQVTRVTSSGQASSQGGSFPTNQDRPDGNAYSTPPIGSGDPTQNHNQHDPWAKPDAFTDLPPF